MKLVQPTKATQNDVAIMKTILDRLDSLISKPNFKKVYANNLQRFDSIISEFNHLLDSQVIAPPSNKTYDWPTHYSETATRFGLPIDDVVFDKVTEEPFQTEV
jgi:hypothetical protein